MSVSLLAIAALAAGIALNRSRLQTPAPVPEIAPDDGVKGAVELEALRRAGI